MMIKIRNIIIVLAMMFCTATSALSAVQVSIGINLPVYPELVRVPGYPVYYAPRLAVNFFFYDSMYWVYQDDNWYVSSWYNGPWWLVEPEYVPVYVLRIPVRYYRHPPAYFRNWRPDAPPRWGEHWGHEWEQQRSGWDKWNRHAAPSPAPLPLYQRQYSGDRYPLQIERQRELQQQHYRYQPRDPVVRQRYREQSMQESPQRERLDVPGEEGFMRQEGPVPPMQGTTQQERPAGAAEGGFRRQDEPAASIPQPRQRRREDVQRPAPVVPQQVRPELQDRGLRPQPEMEQRRQNMQRPQGREERQQVRGNAHEQERKQGQERIRERNQ